MTTTIRLHQPSPNPAAREPLWPVTEVIYEQRDVAMAVLAGLVALHGVLPVVSEDGQTIDLLMKHYQVLDDLRGSRRWVDAEESTDAGDVR